MSTGTDKRGTGGEATDGESPTDSQDMDWVEFEYRPAGVSTAVAVGASLVSVAALVSGAFYPSVGAVLGAAVLVAGLVRGTHKLVTAGAGVMFGALVAGALSGDSVVPVVVAGVATLVAFDAGRYAVQLGHHIGANGTTTRAELHHLGITVAVSSAGAVIGTVVFLVAPDEQPGVALIALLLAGVLFISALVLATDLNDIA